jgi:hypothetical protein
LHSYDLDSIVGDGCGWNSASSELASSGCFRCGKDCKVYQVFHVLVGSGRSSDYRGGSSHRCNAIHSYGVSISLLGIDIGIIAKSI